MCQLLGVALCVLRLCLLGARVCVVFLLLARGGTLCAVCQWALGVTLCVLCLCVLGVTRCVHAVNEQWLRVKVQNVTALCYGRLLLLTCFQRHEEIAT